MYDILVYLFENCQQHEVSNEQERIAKKLSAAGFEESDISEALTWLAGVARGPHRTFAPLPGSGAAFRAYAPKEIAKLDAECRGLLIYFEQSGILSPNTREMSAATDGFSAMMSFFGMRGREGYLQRECHINYWGKTALARRDFSSAGEFPPA